ncbi:MAG: hypothetical protein WAV78_17840 [Xanthobacteraceae bacterium]
MPTIAIVTSTTFGGDNEACFRQGLASVGALPTISPPFQANGNYDEAFLRSKVRDAANTAPNLIVTAGGIAMAVAAQKELGQANDPKFVYLTGDVPQVPGNPNPNAVAGGVNMDNPGGDQARKDILTNAPYHVNAATLYLIVNANSLMSDKDAHPWPPAKVAKFFDNTPNPPDPTNAFNTEFTNLSHRHPAPGGLVISADPYFRLWRTAFTTALGNILPVPVCYPFQDFKDATQPNQPNYDNSAVLDLPQLNDPNDSSNSETAYYKLGWQAGRYLAGTANVRVVPWDWQNRVWGAPS